MFFPSLTAMVGYWATLALEHSRLYALLEIAERAVVGAGIWIASGDGAVYVCGHRGDVGVDGAVRQADLESDCS